MIDEFLQDAMQRMDQAVEHVQGDDGPALVYQAARRFERGDAVAVAQSEGGDDFLVHLVFPTSRVERAARGSAPALPRSGGIRRCDRAWS